VGHHGALLMARDGVFGEAWKLEASIDMGRRGTDERWDAFWMRRPDSKGLGSQRPCAGCCGWFL